MLVVSNVGVANATEASAKTSAVRIMTAV